ncbi:hypothetical protein GGR57DRAFT_467470 [Xylariaceae sp. FL1272]|nr:hypothetical protein GGR57DRAFT_467470 [Xylariaceae sp. FL1272]
MSHKEQIPPEGAPLQVSLIGDILSFQYEHTSKRAGFVASEALARLLRECSVTLSAVIGQSNTHRDSKSSTRFEWDIESHPLRILVYGVRSQKDTVTKILDGGSLFLQRPGVSGYDKRVEYFNPMYLLRAGERMPREAYFSRPEDRKLPGATAETQEHEIETGMALELFNEANGSNARVSSKLKQSPRLVSQLKEHQLTALSMMIEREEGPLEGKAMFPCLWEPSHEDGKILYRHVVTRAVQGLPLPNLHGGILADEMGLGKTLSVIALICYHLDQTSGPTSITQYPFSRTTLIVTPKSTIYGWQQQLERHVRFAGIRSFVYHGPRREDRSNQQNNLDVVITTYDTLRSDWKLDGFLYKHTWTRIILDEAHIIRNSSSEIFDAACQIRARNRWCLTGTPIQNSLNDYGSLLAFVGVPPFTTLAHFKYWISSRIHSNPDDHTLKLLRKLIGATSLRRTKSTPQLSESLRLPLKSEKIEMVEFSPSERQVYDFFKRRSYLLLSKSPSNDEAATSSDKKRRSRAKKKEKAVEKASRKRTGNIIVLISVLRMICNHAEMMLPKNALDAWQNRDFDSVSWASLQELAEEDRTCCVCGVALDIPERSYTETVKLACARHVACEACVVSAEADMTIALACPRCPPTKSPSATEIPISRPSFCMSSKLSSLVRNVLSSLEGTKTDVEASVHIKSVIFSQWTGMLDLVSKALSPRLASSGFTFIRIDGSSTLQQRRVALDKFNSDSNCVVMLATIGAVSEG